MQRFFVLGEHTLCAVNDKPDIGLFLRGALSFPLTVLASYDPLLLGSAQVIHPKGNPKLRLASKADLVRFLGSRSPNFFLEMKHQERETTLSEQALAEFSATVRHEFSVLHESVLRDVEMLAELPALLGKEVDALTDCYRNALINAEVVNDLLKEHEAASQPYISDTDFEIIDGINEAVNAILESSLDGNATEMDPDLAARAKARMQVAFGSMPNDVMPTLCDRALKVYEGILKSHQIMQSQHQLGIILGNFKERLERLDQEQYNLMLLGEIFEQKGDRDTANAVCEQKEGVDWEHLRAHREHINDAIQISDNVLTKYNKEREDYQAKLVSDDPDAMG